MYVVECSQCGKRGEVPKKPRNTMLCPACSSARDVHQELKQDLRRFLRDSPLPEPIAHQVYRLVTNKDDFREHLEELIANQSVLITSLGYTGVLSMAQQLPPEVLESKLWQLAPMGVYASGHLWLVLSDLIHARGDYESAVQASTISKLLLSAVTRAAAGTERDPYLTALVGDQYELLNFAGRPSVERSTEQRGRRKFDVHSCEDGSEAWFDVTALIAFHESLRDQQ